MAAALKVSPHHIRRICARYRETGKLHEPGRPGRRPLPEPTVSEVQAVLDMHSSEPIGVMRTRMRLQDAGFVTSYNRTCRIMKEHDLVTPSAAKSRKRKWVRYERKYSNAMWHVDWHVMKDPRFGGLNLVTYMDDSSRCVTGAAFFKETTSENATAVLIHAIDRFGTLATILSDNGSCFVGAGGVIRRRDHGWLHALNPN